MVAAFITVNHTSESAANSGSSCSDPKCHGVSAEIKPRYVFWEHRLCAENRTLGEEGERWEVGVRRLRRQSDRQSKRNVRSAYDWCIQMYWQVTVLFSTLNLPQLRPEHPISFQRSFRLKVNFFAPLSDSSTSVAKLACQWTHSWTFEYRHAWPCE